MNQYKQNLLNTSEVITNDLKSKSQQEIQKENVFYNSLSNQREQSNVHHLKYEILKYENIDSTNEEARRLTELAHHTDSWKDKIIIAEMQTRGKGRLGRHWYSPPGNLYLTIVKKLPVEMIKLPQISLVVGIAIHRVLKTIIPSTHHLALKWPNDILVNGMKLGGILVETDYQTNSQDPICFIGIGINLSSAPDMIAYPATSLLNFIDDLPTKDHLICLIINELDITIEEWLKNGLTSLREEWLWAAHGLGKPVCARVENGFMLYGRFVTLTPEGAVLIEDDDGNAHTVSSSEITYLS